MVIHPGAEAIFAGADLYRVSVSRMVPQYRSHRPSQGQQTTAIWLDVQRPKQTEYQRFTRAPARGLTHYTEDVITAEWAAKRAKKSPEGAARRQARSISSTSRRIRSSSKHRGCLRGTSPIQWPSAADRRSAVYPICRTAATSGPHRARNCRRFARRPRGPTQAPPGIWPA